MSEPTQRLDPGTARIPSEDCHAELLATYDEALATGSGTRHDWSRDLDAAGQQRFSENQKCLHLLEQLFPRQRCSQPDAPRQLGRFTIVRELGRGGFGIVYLADDPVLCRQVALKVPQGNVVLSAELRERFLREAKAAGKLNHPNLVRVLDAGQAGLVYIVSDYCPGPTLAQWLKTSAPFRPRVAAQIVAEIARAVAYIHSQGILHRDIKPSNILLDPATSAATTRQELAFTPRLTDFGLARLADAEGMETVSGAILGTPAYMAPEQAHGRAKDSGAAADVYSLGAVLYELLTGRPPFQGETPVELLAKLVSEEVVGPRRLQPAIPRDLEAICLKCLEKDSKRRYATAEAIVHDLKNWLEGRPTLARPAPLWSRGLKWARRRPSLAVGLTLSVLMLVSVALGAAWSWRQQLQHWEALSAFAQRDQRQAAEIQRRGEDRDRLQQAHDYVNDIRLAASYRRDERAVTLTDVLSPHLADAGQADNREFCWHYLWRQAEHSMVFSGGHADLQGITFTPDGLILNDDHGYVTHWDLSARRPRSEIPMGQGTTWVSADGSRIVFRPGPSPSQQVSYHDARSGELIAKLRMPADVHAAAISADGKHVALSTDLELSLQDTSMLAGDVDANGRGDLVYVHPTEAGLICSVQLSRTDGTWKSITSFMPEFTETPTNPPLLGDVNGDGRADLVFVTVDSLEEQVVVHVLAPGADGVFGALAESQLQWIPEIAKRAPLLADIDGDGRAELIVAAYDSTLDTTIVQTAAGKGDRTLAPWRREILKEHLFDMPALAADVNGDGFVDLITATRRKGKGVFVRTALSRGDGSFDPSPETVLPDGNRLATSPLSLAGDVNGDQKADLIFVFYDDKLKHVATRIAPGLGDGQFGAPLAKSVNLSQEDLQYPLRVADTNGDRMADLIFDRRRVDQNLRISTLTGREDYRFGLGGGTDFGRSQSVMMLWTPETNQRQIIWGHRTLQEPGSAVHHGQPWTMQFSPDGNRLAICYDACTKGVSGEDWTCRLQDLRARDQGEDVQTGSSLISAVAFSPDGNSIATGSHAMEVIVWDLATGRRRFVFEGMEAPVWRLAFSPDGQTLAAGMYWPGVPDVPNHLAVWDLATGTRREPPNLVQPHAVKALAFSPDGKTLALGCQGDRLRFCDLTGFEEHVDIPAHTPSEAWGVAFSPSRPMFATSGDDDLCKLWDMRTRQEIARCSGAPSLLGVVAFAPHGRLMATAGFDGKVRFWNAHDGLPEAVLDAHQGPVRSIAFSPQGELLASAGSDTIVRVWDVDAQQPLCSLNGHTDKVRAVVFTAEGKTLVSAGSDKSLRFWDVVNGQCLRTITDIDELMSLSHCPQANLLAVARIDGDVELRDAETGELERLLKGHSQGVLSVAFSPDGKTLASGGLDRVVRLWHVATRRELLAFDDLPAQINGVAFSADGRTLAATCHDGSVRLWETAR